MIGGDTMTMSLEEEEAHTRTDGDVMVVVVMGSHCYSDSDARNDDSDGSHCCPPPRCAAADRRPVSSLSCLLLSFDPFREHCQPLLDLLKQRRSCWSWALSM
jgi:hypothetical protein